MDPRQHPREGVKTLEKLNDLHATLQILHTNVGYFLKWTLDKLICKKSCHYLIPETILLL